MQQKVKKSKRVLALLLAVSTILTGCAGNVKTGLYADEVSESTEDFMDVEDLDESTSNEVTEDTSQVETEPEEKVLDLENESYLDVEDLSIPDEFNTEEDDYVYDTIDEDYKDVPSKGFLLKIEEGGTLMMMSCSLTEFLCSVWRSGEDVWYRDEPSGEEYKLKEIKDGYYCVPLSEKGRHEGGVLASDGYMVKASLPQFSESGFFTEYADIAVDLDGKSLVFVEVSASNSAGIKKPKRVQSRVSNGGRPVGEAQCIGKSAGAEHTAAYQILFNGVDARTGCCGLASKRGLVVGGTYPVREWSGSLGDFSDIDARNSAIIMLTTSCRGNYVDSSAGTNNAIGLFCKSGYEIPGYGFLNFAQMHACLSYWMSGDQSYNSTAGVSQAWMDGVATACNTWAENHADVLNGTTLNQIRGQDVGGLQNIYTIFYMQQDYVQIIKKPDPTCDSVLYFGSGSNKKINGLYADLTADFTIKNQATGETIEVSTKSDGTSDPVAVKSGTYKIREVKAPKGYSVQEDMQLVTVKSGDGTKQVTFVDKPKGDPSGISLHKKAEGADSNSGEVDQIEGSIDYSQARFTVYYYDNLNGKSNGWNSDKKKKQWVFKPAVGANNNVVSFNQATCKVSGNYWEYREGRLTKKIWLAGSYAIKETTNPKGTKANNKVYYATVDYNGDWSWDTSYTTAEDGRLIIEHKRDPYIENTSKGIGFSLIKYARATGSTTPIAGTSFNGITFRLYNLSTNAVEKGKITGNASDDNVWIPKGGAICDYTLTDGNTKITFTGLPVGSYAIQEITGSTDGCYPIECPYPDQSSKSTDGFYATVDVRVDTSNELYVVNTTDGLNQVIRPANASGGTNNNGFTGDYGYKAVYDANIAAGGTAASAQVAALTQIKNYKNNGAAYNNIPTGAVNKEVYGDVGAVKHDFDICKTNFANSYPTASNDFNHGNLQDSAGNRVFDQGDGSIYNVKFEIYNSTGRTIILQDDTLKTPNELCATITVRGDIFTNDLTPINLGVGARTGGTIPPHVTVRDTIDNYLPFGAYTIKEIVGDNVSYLLYNKNPLNTESTTQLVTFVSQRGLNYKQFSHSDPTTGKPVYKPESVEYDNSVKRGGVQIRKLDTDVVDTEHDKTAQGDATLEGTEFTLINQSEKPIYYKKSGEADKLVESGNVIDVLVTDEEGFTATDVNALPYGTYEIQETKPPIGYLLEDHNGKTLKSVVFTIREDGDIIKSIEYDATLIDELNAGNTGEITSSDKFIEDDVIRGGLQIQKYDKEIEKSEALGGLDRGENEFGTHLDGITFEIKSASDNPVYVVVDGVGSWYQKGEPIMQIVAHWNTELHCYTAETESFQYQVPDYDINTTPNATETKAIRLPYGTYDVYEVSGTDSYLIDNETIWRYEIREDGKLVTDAKRVDREGNYIDDSDKIAVNYNQVVRGDITLTKTMDGTSARLERIPFLVENVSTGEKHVIITGANGTFDSRTNKNLTPPHGHSIDTNANDWILEEIEEAAKTGNEYVVDSYNDPRVNLDAGLWFGMGEEYKCTEHYSYDNHSGHTTACGGVLAEPDDDLGALIYGKYKLTELRCTANQSMKILPSQTFYVYKNDYTLALYEVNDTEGPTLTTRLLSEASGIHSVPEGDTCDLVEEVNMENLWIGQDPYYDRFGQLHEPYKLVSNLYYTDNEDSMVLNPETNRPYEVVKYFNNGTESSWVENLVFEDVDMSQLQRGVGIVCITKLYLKDEFVYEETQDKYGLNHKDIAETVWFPHITTKLRDITTGDNIALTPDVGSVGLIDTVSYYDLAPYSYLTRVANMSDEYIKPESYYVVGTLYDITDPDNKFVVKTTRTQFNTSIGENGYNGTVDLRYENLNLVAGHTYCATAELYASKSNVLLARHEDFEDENQTVYTVSIGTTANDNKTGTHTGTVADDEDGIEIFEDTVEYNNLVVGKTYTITGTLYDVATGEPLLEDGREITASTELKPKTKEDCYGTVKLQFRLKTSTLYNKTIVAFEDLYYDRKKIATHSEIKDKEQSVNYPNVSTVVLDSLTMDNVASGGSVYYICDDVKLTNLTVGERYSVTGVLMDKATGEYLGKDLGIDMLVSTSEVFEAKDTTMVIRLAYKSDKVPESGLQGKTGVAFCTLLSENGTVVRHHENIDDVDQTFYIPDVGTNAISGEGLKEQLASKKPVVIKDTVSCKNLIVGKTYKVNGILYDKETGVPLLIGNSKVTSSLVFTAEEVNQDVVLEFTISDPSILEGNTIVAFEDLLHNDKIVAVHHEIDDFDQSIKFPKIRTEASDALTALDESVASENTNLKDVISYDNLEKGATYSVKTTLYDKETGEPARFPEGYLLVTTDFKAAEVGEVKDVSTEYVSLEELNAALESATESTTNLGVTKSEEVQSGTVEIAINDVNTLDYLGKTLVVYEYVYRDGVLIAIHDDIDDDLQDIKFIETTSLALDSQTRIQEANYGDITIQDTVTLKNLTEGRTYRVVSSIMGKATGEIAVVDGNEVRTEYAFTASGSSEVIEVNTPIKAESLKGGTYVLFIDLMRGDKVVSEHRDINNLKQTFYLPDAVTHARDEKTGLIEGIVREDAVIIDEIVYSNLTYGESYYAVGTLCDYDTKEQLIVNGKPVTSEVKFIAGVDGEIDYTKDVDLSGYPQNTYNSPNRPSIIGSERASGSIETKFKFDATGLEGKTVVVVEDIYTWDGKLVSHHRDLEDEAQMVKFPKVGTTMTDKDTGVHESQGTKDEVYVDMVSYENLIPGKTYTISGILMNQKTNEPLIIDGETVTATKDFVPETSNGVEPLEYHLDTSKLVGEDIVSFEDIIRDGITVGTHADINDKDQTVAVIDFETTALDTKTGTHESAASESAVIVDKVKYTNLFSPGEEYVLKGTLIHKKTNTPIKLNGTEEVVNSMSFVPEDRDGTVEMEFSVNTADLEAEDIVVYQELYKDGEMIATHCEIDNVDETVYIPKVITTAWDSETKDHEALAQKNHVLVDTVSYENLTYGEKYVAFAKVYDVETGEYIEGFSGAREFTAGFAANYDNWVLGDLKDTLDGLVDVIFHNRTSGTVDVVIPYDSSNLDGHTVVVYEYIYRVDTVDEISENMLVARHEDITDINQQLTYPEIGTTMLDTDTETDESQATKEDSYTDIVAYKGLIPGKTYTVSGVLMDKSTGKPLLVDGEQVTASKEFVPTEPDGFVEVVYELDSSILEGKDVVSFEDVERDGIKVGTHADIEDENQTVAVINIHTTALDTKTGTHEGLASESSVLVDTVEYVNLRHVGEEYVLEGTLVHKKTGEPIKLYGTEETKVTMPFTPESRDGEVTMEFTVDTRELKNEDIVVCQVLYKDGVEIARHDDLTDIWETVYIPNVKTHAKDKVTEDHEALASEDAVIIDSVEYENLTYGANYMLYTTVYCLEDGEEVEDISTITSFKAGHDSGIDALDVAKGWVLSAVDAVTGSDFSKRASGVVDVELNLDARPYAGKTLVIYEYMYRADSEEEMVANNLVGIHRDINDTEQTIYYPGLGTTMVDAETGDHESQATENDVYIDTVEYTNLQVGEEYTITGVLMDKDTGEPLLQDGEKITGSVTFIAENSNGFVEVEYHFDSSLLEGKDVVSFEDLHHDGKHVGTHADINDRDQTVAVINIHTKAFSKNTNNHDTLADRPVEIIDTVEYVNLFYPGEKYTMVGTVVDKLTGEEVKLYDSEETSVEVEFVPEERDGSVDISFNIDTKDLEGRDLVIFERLYKDGVEIAKHCDLEDSEETVYIPKIRTKAFDAKTLTSEGYAEKETTIVDTISYNNLTKGKKYVAHAVLYDLETLKPIPNAEGWKWFVATDEVDNVTPSEPSTEDIDYAVRVDGTVDVSITWNAIDYAGKKVVVYEYVYQVEEGAPNAPGDDSKPDKEPKDEDLVGKHTDPEDNEQIISYPEIGTTMTDNSNGLHEGHANEETTYTDRVEYTNLKVGNKYTVSGILMDKETGEPLLVDGKEITGSVTFVAEKPNGYVNVVYKFNSSALYGKDVVSFETLENNKKVVATHTDIKDEGQTVKVIKIGTKAKDKLTGTQESLAQPGTKFVDTVEYVNLTVGKKYKFVGTLVNKDTGEKLAMEGAVAEKVFVAETENGSIDVEFTIDSSLMANMNLVVYEVLYGYPDDKPDEPEEIAKHEDPEDDDQSLYIPKVTTKAYDYTTQGKQGNAAEVTKIVDTVSYSNLTFGETYVAYGVLYSKSTKTPIAVNGKQVTSTKLFKVLGEGEVVPETIDSAIRRNGTVDVEFEFDGTGFSGEDLVVYEYIYRVESETNLDPSKVVAKHTDIEDAQQTVSYPEIRTTLVSSENGTHEIQADKKLVLVDTIKYKNLKPNKEYTVSGVLYDKETGTPIKVNGKKVKSTTTFKPKKKNGTVDVTFTFDATAIIGKDVVAFEKLFDVNGYLIAEHEDIDDEDQTVGIVDIHTTAVDGENNTHEMSLKDSAVLVDTVTYTNLTVGKKYDLHGTVIDKETGEKVAEATAAFTPDKRNGTAKVEFTINTNNLKGKTLVVFEQLFDGDKLIADHEDPNDEAQTVTVPNSKIPERLIPKTGDVIFILLILGLLALALGIGGKMLTARRKEDEDDLDN